MPLPRVTRSLRGTSMNAQRVLLLVRLRRNRLVVPKMRLIVRTMSVSVCSSCFLNSACPQITRNDQSIRRWYIVLPDG